MSFEKNAKERENIAFFWKERMPKPSRKLIELHAVNILLHLIRTFEWGFCELTPSNKSTFSLSKTCISIIEKTVKLGNIGIKININWATVCRIVDGTQIFYRSELFLSPKLRTWSLIHGIVRIPILTTCYCMCTSIIVNTGYREDCSPKIMVSEVANTGTVMWAKRKHTRNKLHNKEIEFAELQSQYRKYIWTVCKPNQCWIGFNNYFRSNKACFYC